MKERNGKIEGMNVCMDRDERRMEKESVTRRWERRRERR